MIETFLSGAIVLAALVVSRLFWQFRRKTGERLFGFFAVAFLLLGVERFCVEFISNNPHSLLYFIRLFAFLVILYAIMDKNRVEKNM